MLISVVWLCTWNCIEYQEHRAELDLAARGERDLTARGERYFAARGLTEPRGGGGAERDLTARGERALAARGERALAARGERDLTAREDCAGEIATSPRWDAGEKSATSMRGNATARGRRGESAGRARGAGTARAHLLPGLRAPGPPALFSHPGPGPLVTLPCANYGALPPAAPQLANS